MDCYFLGLFSYTITNFSASAWFVRDCRKSLHALWLRCWLVMLIYFDVQLESIVRYVLELDVILLYLVLFR